MENCLARVLACAEQIIGGCDPELSLSDVVAREEPWIELHDHTAAFAGFQLDTVEGGKSRYETGWSGQ